MSDRLTRRNFLAAVGTAAVSRGTLSRLAFAADEPAQTPHRGTNSTLDYGSTWELVAMLANRKISAVELLEHAIARIEALDQRINAVVVRDFERAHSAAVAADAALARGDRAPLLGLPMTVKEALNVTGMPTTWGMPMFKGWMPKQDSVVIARLKSAGAIIIGKTNVPFAISDWQSYNEIYGTTNNPWDLSRTPGAHRAVLPLRWPQAMFPWSSAQTSPALSAPRLHSAACSATNQAMESSPWADSRPRPSNNG